MWCGRFSSPQLEHSFGFAATSESWARRLLRRDLETLFCWTAMSGAFVVWGPHVPGWEVAAVFHSGPDWVLRRFMRGAARCPTLSEVRRAKYCESARMQALSWAHRPVEGLCPLSGFNPCRLPVHPAGPQAPQRAVHPRPSWASDPVGYRPSAPMPRHPCADSQAGRAPALPA